MSCLALAPGRLLLSGWSSPFLVGPRSSARRGSAPGNSSCSLPPEALQRYLVLVYPGLVGAVTMASCSILALTHLLFEFKGEHCFLEGLVSPRGRTVPRRSGQGGYQDEEWSWEGGRRAGPEPNCLPPSLLPSSAFLLPQGPESPRVGAGGG